MKPHKDIIDSVPTKEPRPAEHSSDAGSKIQIKPEDFRRNRRIENSKEAMKDYHNPVTEACGEIDTWLASSKNKNQELFRVWMLLISIFLGFSGLMALGGFL